MLCAGPEQFSGSERHARRDVGDRPTLFKNLKYFAQRTFETASARCRRGSAAGVDIVA
jgi:hypothetical protein